MLRSDGGWGKDPQSRAQGCRLAPSCWVFSSATDHECGVFLRMHRGQRAPNLEDAGLSFSISQVLTRGHRHQRRMQHLCPPPAPGRQEGPSWARRRPCGQRPDDPLARSSVSACGHFQGPASCDAAHGRTDSRSNSKCEAVGLQLGGQRLSVNVSPNAK